jgi:hypothetical protein
MKCMSVAKAMVARGETTWTKLVELGMVNPEANLFKKAFEEAANRPAPKAPEGE